MAGVTSPITELAAPIMAVTAPVTAITAPITAVTAPVPAVTAPDTADAAPPRRADVGTPGRRRLRVPLRLSRASKAATRQAWRVVGGAGNRGGVSLRGGSFHYPIQGLADRKILTEAMPSDTCLTVDGAGSVVGADLNKPEFTKCPLHKPNASNVSRK